MDQEYTLIAATKEEVPRTTSTVASVANSVISLSILVKLMSSACNWGHAQVPTTICPLLEIRMMPSLLVHRNSCKLGQFRKTMFP